MTARRRDFLLLVTLAAAVATPAAGQTVAPSPESSGTRGAASVPDFSGVWTHPYWPGFDPPLSGSGPVVNRSRLPNGVGNRSATTPIRS